MRSRRETSVSTLPSQATHSAAARRLMPSPFDHTHPRRLPALLRILILVSFPSRHRIPGPSIVNFCLP
jgi:hypothetical protein